MKFIAALLVILLAVEPAIAAPLFSNPCAEQGQREGAMIKTGGAFACGLVGGLTLGLIGTGIAFAAQGSPRAPEMQAQVAAVRGLDERCLYDYNREFESAGKFQKRKAAVAGGIMGTAAIVVAVLSATRSHRTKGLSRRGE